MCDIWGSHIQVLGKGKKGILSFIWSLNSRADRREPTCQQTPDISRSTRFTFTIFGSSHLLLTSCNQFINLWTAWLVVPIPGIERGPSDTWCTKPKAHCFQPLGHADRMGVCYTHSKSCDSFSVFVNAKVSIPSGTLFMTHVCNGSCHF